MISFASDYIAGAHPVIMQKITKKQTIGKLKADMERTNIVRRQKKRSNRHFNVQMEKSFS